MAEIMVRFLTGYIAIMSLLGFLLMGMDKQRARRKRWRIPERTLILLSFLGGGIGSALGMYVFRHKTKHLKFLVLLPASAILMIGLLSILYLNFT